MGRPKSPFSLTNYTRTWSFFRKWLKPLATWRIFSYFFAACNTIDDPSWKSHILWSVGWFSPEFHPSFPFEDPFSTPYTWVLPWISSLAIVSDSCGLGPSQLLPWVRSSPHLCCWWPHQTSRPELLPASWPSTAGFDTDTSNSAGPHGSLPLWFLLRGLGQFQGFFVLRNFMLQTY